MQRDEIQQAHGTQAVLPAYRISEGTETRTVQL